MDYLIIGIVFYFFIAIIVRQINEKALNLLSDDEKAAFLNMFSNQRKYNLIPMLIYLLLFMIINRFFHIDNLLMIFLAVIVVHNIITMILSYRKIRGLKLPKKFQTLTLTGNVLSMFALFSFFVLLLMNNS